MWETLPRLWERFSSGAYDPRAVVVELLLIGLSVSWCAGVLHGTRGTRLLRGLLVLLVGVTLVVRVLSSQMGWTRLELLYRYFVIGLAFIALVAFQPELRRALIRAGTVGFLRRRTSHTDVVAALVESAAWLSRHRHGALVAIQRDVPLGNWTEHGTQMNAFVSSNLLNSIFYPNSPLHDLGVVIRADRVVAANCQFPLAESGEVDPTLGGRHRAAVGLSQESDAVILVISEETGGISLAEQGSLRRNLSLDDLNTELERRLVGQRALMSRGRSWSMSLLWRFVRQGLIIVPITVVIWFMADQASLIRADGIPILITVKHDSGIQAEIVQPQPAMFTANVRGSTRAIENLKSQTANHPLAVDWKLPATIEAAPDLKFDAEQIVSNSDAIRSLGLAVEQVAPPQISLSVDELVTIDMPIRAESAAIRTADARFTPAEVHVSLRRRDLIRLTPDQRYVTVRLDGRLGGIAEEETRTLSGLTIESRVAGMSVVRIDPPTVDASIRVAGQRIERKLTGIVVQLAGSPQILQRYDVALPDPKEWRIDVTVRGDRVAVEALQGDDVRALATITGEPSVLNDVRTAEVTLILPSGVSAVGPARLVRYTLTPKEIKP